MDQDAEKCSKGVNQIKPRVQQHLKASVSPAIHLQAHNVFPWLWGFVHEIHFFPNLSFLFY